MTRRIAVAAAFGLLAATLALALFLLVEPETWRTGSASGQASDRATGVGRLGSAVAQTARSRADLSALVNVAPETPWLPLDASTRLTRIGVGSCLHQNYPMPIWESVLAAKPDLFLMVGDNVYGDIKSGDPNQLGRAYIKQSAQPEFAKARAAFPFLATWDDHDYGLNDGGAGYRFQPQAAHFFRTFFGLTDARQDDGGIYYARTIGPAGQRVQIIMLDTRSFRSDLQRKSASFPHWGKYEPVADTGGTMLGAAQWAWLAEQLRAPAEIRLLVSSVQVLANGHGWERWGNLPHERARLEALIAQTGARGVVLLSGDRHSGALFRKPLTDAAQPNLIEMTASSLNRAFGPSRDTRLAPLVSEIVWRENFGLVEIDWEGRTLTLGLRGMENSTRAEMTVPFSALGLE
ncbi:MAG: alkaline phosphatase D family protein [Pseudomonadota bacterium]